jgi:hypothetical protein
LDSHKTARVQITHQHSFFQEATAEDDDVLFEEEEELAEEA